MAEQRGGEVSYNKKSLNLTQADESIKKIDHSGSDGRDVLFTPEYFEQLNCGRKTYQAFDLNVGTFDIHGGENFAGTASYDSGERVQIGGGATKLLKGRQVSKEGKYRTKTTYFNGQNRKKANRDMKFYKKKVFSVRGVGAADPTPAVSPPIVQMANNLIDGDDDGGIKTSTVLEYQGPFWEDNFYDQFLDQNLEKENIDDDDGGIETATTVSNLIGSSSSLDDLFSDLNFGNLDFGIDGKYDCIRSECDGVAGSGISIRSRPSFGFNDGSQCSAPRRIRLQRRISEDSENQEFGRDTNRLDYFRVTAFDLHGDDHFAGVSTYGGGTRDRGVVVGRSMEQEGGSDTDTAVAGGGARIRRGPVRFSTNNGSESVVQRLEQERGNGGGGGRGSCIVEGPRSVEERGSVTAGAGGAGGGAVVQRLKQEGATVAMPVTVVVAMAVMMMVMVVVMVVFVTLMMKMEVR